MRSIYLASVLSLGFLPAIFATEYLVGVGKDETTGKKGLGFDPSVIHPAVGDIIVWEFRSGQHSVVQSTFENPCTGNGGINTGVQTVSDSLAVDAPGLPTFRVTVNSTDPSWFFDEAAGLCNKGAVLAVNPSSTQTAEAFKENAAKAPPSSSTSPTETTPVATVTQTSATANPTNTTPTSNTAVRANDFKRHTSSILGALSFVALGLL